MTNIYFLFLLLQLSNEIERNFETFLKRYSKEWKQEIFAI